MYIVEVKAEQVWHTSLWTEHLIDKAASAANGETAESLLLMAKEGRGHLWLIMDRDTPKGVCFWKLFDRPDATKVLAVLAVGGNDAEKWWDLLRSELQGRRKAAGAHCMVTIGRPGWAKVYGLKPKGYYYEDFG